MSKAHFLTWKMIILKKVLYIRKNHANDRMYNERSPCREVDSIPFSVDERTCPDVAIPFSLHLLSRHGKKSIANSNSRRMQCSFSNYRKKVVWVYSFLKSVNSLRSRTYVQCTFRGTFFSSVIT